MLDITAEFDFRTTDTQTGWVWARLGQCLVLKIGGGRDDKHKLIHDSTLKYFTFVIIVTMLYS